MKGKHLYNVRYKSGDGEHMHPSRFGIRFDNEIEKGDVIEYNGQTFIVEEVKGLLLETSVVKVHKGVD